MTDLLVPLYGLPSVTDQTEGPRVRVAMAYEREQVVAYVRDTWNERWASEVACAFSSHPIRCHIAVANGKMCGFACHDTTFRGFFGPMGVTPDAQGAGIGRKLLLEALRAMRSRGYVYAVIGNVEEALGFYVKTVGASPISGSRPGAYEFDLESS